jgi:hypothetical protein
MGVDVEVGAGGGGSRVSVENRLSSAQRDGMGAREPLANITVLHSLVNS